MSLFSIEQIESQLENGDIDKNQYYDLLTEQIIKMSVNETSLCIDVGCHEGAFLRTMMRYAPNGTFLAFEPLQHLFIKLKNFFISKNVHIFDYALSNTEGEANFNYVITNPGYSGLIKRKYDRPNEEDAQITVQTHTLDSLMDNHTFGKIDFIKIDVEGAEYLVLEGAAKRIISDRPVIVFEHGIGGSDCYGIGPEEIYNFFYNRCNMRVSLLPNWLRGCDALDLSAFCEEYFTCRNFYFIAHP